MNFIQLILATNIAHRPSNTPNDTPNDMACDEQPYSRDESSPVVRSSVFGSWLGADYSTLRCGRSEV